MNHLQCSVPFICHLAVFQYQPSVFYVRITYDYEKKLYDDHLQQLQVMEKNYMTMTKEVEKLRAELNNSANMDGRAGAMSINSKFLLLCLFNSTLV